MPAPNNVPMVSLQRHSKMDSTTKVLLHCILNAFSDCFWRCWWHCCTSATECYIWYSCSGLSHAQYLALASKPFVTTPKTVRVAAVVGTSSTSCLNNATSVTTTRAVRTAAAACHTVNFICQQLDFVRSIPAMRTV